MTHADQEASAAAQQDLADLVGPEAAARLVHAADDTAAALVLTDLEVPAPPPPSEPGAVPVDLTEFGVLGGPIARFVLALARVLRATPRVRLWSGTGTELARPRDRPGVVRVLLVLRGERRASVWGPDGDHSLIELRPGRPLVALPRSQVEVIGLDGEWVMVEVRLELGASSDGPEELPAPCF